MSALIYDAAERLKAKFETSDPFELIDSLKINLFIRGGLGNLKGFYYMTHRQRYIVINANLPEHDQRMVAAHELGHDQLHQYLAKVSPLKDFALYNMTSKAEYQANVFASELLIEDKDITACIADDMDYFGM